ncbi:MAG TPA: urate hydroxylase PuuD, partial [Elusimicrobiota bacterium]|nr:urate hydroxylase PuuD [Elusimicrobiota bacterium]
MAADMFTNFHLFVRWLHVWAGIIWIGHLYFFNFVNAPFQGGLEKELKPKVNPPLVLRALFFFRWGAMWTFLFGLALFSMIYWPMGGALLDADGRMSQRAMWILFGGLLGTIMWFNVWFIIWPRQKIIIPAIMTGNKPADFDALVATAGKFSRINTYLSVPMLFGMGARKHFPSGTTSMTLAFMAGVFVVGFGIAYHIVNGAAAKVAKEF